MVSSRALPSARSAGPRKCRSPRKERRRGTSWPCSRFRVPSRGQSGDLAYGEASAGVIRPARVRGRPPWEPAPRLPGMADASGRPGGLTPSPDAGRPVGGIWPRPGFEPSPSCRCSSMAPPRRLRAAAGPDDRRAAGVVADLRRGNFPDREIPGVPIGGMADIAVGLLLLSTLSSATSLLAGSAYLLLLGVGIGSVIQVLVLITQNPCRGPAQMDRLGPHPRPRGRDGQVVSCEAVIREAGQLLWPGKDHPPL